MRTSTHNPEFYVVWEASHTRSGIEICLYEVGPDWYFVAVCPKCSTLPWVIGKSWKCGDCDITFQPVDDDNSFSFEVAQVRRGFAEDAINWFKHWTKNEEFKIDFGDGYTIEVTR